MRAVTEGVETMDRDRQLAHTPALLRQGRAGLGVAALAEPARQDSRAAASRADGGLPGLPHFAPKAKRVIYLFQSGAPSQIDLFDYKPQLAGSRQDGAARFDPHGPAADRHDLRRRPAFRSRRRSSSSRSTAIAARGSASCCRTRPSVADDLCFIKSMHTEAINHDPAVTFFQTGSQLAGRPQHRRLARLRPGQREPGPAGVRRDDLAGQRQSERSAALRPAVGQRLPADASTRA